MPVKASVVIPAYNRRELLRRTLLSLANQTFPADQFEVVVADDGSTDGTREMVSTLDVPYPLRYVRQPKRGRAAARNAGMRAAAADLIIFLDSDIAVCPEFVQAHVEAHIDTRLVVIGPVICVAARGAPRSTPPPLGAQTPAVLAPRHPAR
ncbi:MAG: glycosyltransferase family 2 protein, partial [Firmicutes bacterium]|nr:glycosyltransferase family 2 protein [Bacillota bacterium]